jgi:hypothetical protein
MAYMIRERERERNRERNRERWSRPILRTLVRLRGNNKKSGMTRTRKGGTKREGMAGME